MSWLLVASLACATPPPDSNHAGSRDAAPSGGLASPGATAQETADTAQVHAPGGGGRPVELGEAELDYKDERERQALLGLDYGEGRAGRVTVDHEEAARILADFDAGSGAELAEEQYQAGLALYARNARLEAIAAHTRAVLLDPQRALLYQGLGDALRSERFESRAEAAYRSGLDRRPSAGLHTRLAEILWMRAERESAIDEAQLALALEPDHARANADLARWYYFVNDYASAWNYLHRCEGLGAPLPAQFRPLLTERMPEPRR